MTLGCTTRVSSAEVSCCGALPIDRLQSTWGTRPPLTTGGGGLGRAGGAARSSRGLRRCGEVWASRLGLSAASTNWLSLQIMTGSSRSSSSRCISHRRAGVSAQRLEHINDGP